MTSPITTLPLAASADRPVNLHLQQELVCGTSVEPRPYQLRIAAKAISMFHGQYRDRSDTMLPQASSVMIESPTGSGKTVIGLAIARWMQQRHGLSVGWVAMHRNLLQQAQQENHDRGFNVQMQTISMFDKNPPQVDLLVVDEAQHDAAMSMANLHCSVAASKILGLTATPFRTDRIKLCFDQVITDAGIHALIQDGYLSRYHHYTMPEYQPDAVAEFYLADRSRWGKTLMFFHRREQCFDCHSRLRRAGVTAEVVTSSSDRERQLADFDQGRVEVLINMNILTEGFDCPALKTVFCRPSGKGCTIQMGGRVFRKHSDLPFKQIVQCGKTRHPFVKTAMADEQYVWTEGSWRTLKLNRRIEAISNNVRRLISRSRTQLPDVVANHRARSLPWQNRSE